MPYLDRKRRLIAFVSAMAILIATPLGVVASDAFIDVPDSNVHHDDITWLRDNGVTVGCNPPANTEFCPGEPVLRQQMASFIRRLSENQIVDAATAETAETLDGLDSTEFMQADPIVTSIGGNAWTMHEHGAELVRWVSHVVAKGFVNLSLRAPHQVGGFEYGLAELQICYRAEAPTFIESIDIFRTNEDVEPEWAFHDSTPRNGQGCFTISPGVAVGEGLGLVVKTGGPEFVRLGGVKATWTTEAAANPAPPLDGNPPWNGFP